MTDHDFSEHNDQPNMPSRRDFLRKAAAGAALVGLGGKVLAAPGGAGVHAKFNLEPGDDAHTGMIYRAIPLCEIRISSIACNPAGEPSIRRMVELGCNYFHKVDACGSRRYRQSLDWDKYYCDVVIDHLGKQEAIDEFERRRKNAGVDVVHFFKIHSTLTKPEQLKTQTAIFDAFETLREQGKTKWLATSLHAGGPKMFHACLDDGRFKMIQIPVNPLVWGPAWHEGVRKAQARGIAIFAMKSLAGGPAKWQENEKAKKALHDFWPRGTSAAIAMLHWVLDRPGLTAAVPDSPNVQIASENCEAGGSRLTAWERDGIERWAAAMAGTWCHFCGTCEASCPSGLPISSMLRYRMYAKDYGNVAGARKLYAELPEDRRIDACTDCGKCDEVCPHGLRVHDFLADARRRLT